MALQTIARVLVVGAGLMGRQIALNAAMHGFSTALTDASPEALESAGNWAAGYLNTSVAKGKTERGEADAALEKLRFVESVQPEAENADLIIEAIVEKLEVKRDLFRNLGKWAHPDCVLTTNSSYLLSSNFKDDVPNPGRLANLHFFNPAMRMQLVEIVCGDHIVDHTVELLRSFVMAIGKTPVMINKEVEGFLVNRLLRAVQSEAYYLLENGVASFSDIDLAAEKGLNWPMGPFRLMDYTGLDLNYHARLEKFQKTGAPEDAIPSELAKRFANGDFGRKTGKGWYSYDK